MFPLENTSGQRKPFGSSRYEPTLKPTVQLVLERIHPEDLPLVQEAMAGVSEHGSDVDVEHRLLMPDGSVKTIRVLGHTSNDRVGKPTFLGAMTDISTMKNAFEEIQRLKDQLYKENLALREEIDITRMFEEIVGSSPALQTVLSQVAKVAPTDSTVLITGETGTGKELIARAIHKRSQRSSRAFVSVNCAAIPQDLIASELFGHEKGPLPARLSGAWAASSRLKGAQFSWMKSVNYRRKPRSRSCGCCKNANFSVSAAMSLFALMFEWSPPPIVIWRLLSRKAGFATICSIDSMCFPFEVPPLARTKRRHSVAGRVFRRSLCQ